MNTAIIVAAGTGSRFGSERPKQFLEIFGKPIIRYSMERFNEASSVDAIIVVVSGNELDDFRMLSAEFGIGKLRSVVAGGATRAESVANGLKAIDRETQIVAIHDGARPLVSVNEIESTISAAASVGAACLTAPLNDTIKHVDGSTIIGTADRRSLRRALTPQAFRLEILQRAMIGADLTDAVTDECFLVERLGHQIASVLGSTKNIKITHPEDLIFFEAFVGRGYLD